jgi:hypothetical protein
MLAPNSIKSYAVNKTHMKLDFEFKEASSRDDAESILEIWHYSPFVGVKNYVDKFSLYLSL